MVSNIKVSNMKVETDINTLYLDNRKCHDSSSVFSLRIETRYLNRIFSINGAIFLNLFFIALSTQNVELCTKVAKFKI